MADLYALNHENKNFIHARFSAGEDPLNSYKRIVENCLYPDVMENQPIGIAKAKKAISQYKKANGDQFGVVELMVSFVECGNKFTLDYGDIDEDFYYSLERMFGKAIIELKKLDEKAIEVFRPRLEQIVISSNGIGWGYHDTLADIYYNAFSD